jgi:hypothetical protein
MQEDEGHGAEEPGRDLDEFAMRNVSEFFYAGRPAVIVRTTHLRGSDEEGQVSEPRRPAALKMVRNQPIYGG